MVFDSFEFAVLFAVVLGLYFFLSHRWQNRLLLVASYVFYGYWDWRFLSLLLGTTVLDYFSGLGIDRAQTPRSRKLWLMCSVTGNLAILGTFKYFNFFIDNLHVLLGLFGISFGDNILRIALPIGVSFYTFQELSYSVDVYRGKLKPTTKFFDFALFVTFFPHLVAGPILRAVDMLPQVLNPRRTSWDKISEGSWLIYWGLFKKVFVADNIARLADSAYRAPGACSAFDILIGTYAFAIQIYCDFSGYSDIARGVAKIIGFELPVNFNVPFLARDPQDFWRRWHISLSQWLRDYLYIPLGGSRGSRNRTLINLSITMALGGLWHGAKWHFVLWGVYQGLLLVGYRLAQGPQGPKPATSRLHDAFRVALMFHFTCIGWILFRAEHTHDLVTIATKFLTDWHWGAAASQAAAVLIGYSLIPVALDAIQFRKDDPFFVHRLPVWTRTAVYVVMYLCLTLGATNMGRPFIYFQF
jgi:alginate O-acetyltransferase complex protein AlgI